MEVILTPRRFSNISINLAGAKEKGAGGYTPELLVAQELPPLLWKGCLDNARH